MIAFYHFLKSSGGAWKHNSSFLEDIAVESQLEIKLNLKLSMKKKINHYNIQLN